MNGLLGIGNFKKFELKKKDIEQILKNRFQRFHKQGIWLNTLAVL